MIKAFSTKGRDEPGHARRAADGFTLLEIMLAVSLMSVVALVTYWCFSTVLTGWKRGMTLMDNLHHGDFVIEQLVSGLRSAYYPDAPRSGMGAYGFTHKDNGNGPYSSDEIGWVKLGGALVGNDCPFMGSPHRVCFKVDTGARGKSEAMVKAWQIIGQPEDFDQEKIEWTPISRRVAGFNCRAAWKTVSDSTDIDWQDEWTNTNELPTAVELTLYLEPIEQEQAPLELKRVVGLPAGALSPHH
ncbi:MAG: prepilin-type N-terminal cleavage/methylation domain-containing protein [Verrucomicrobiota bacterium]|nr:prepilin-type N-terminal cleavage/methylation domain-containing protein [Verrucomicrobiota bacterium]